MPPLWGCKTFTPHRLRFLPLWVSALPGALLSAARAPRKDFYPTDSYQLSEDLSLVRGAHQIGFGVDFIRQMLNSQSFNGFPSFGFTGQEAGGGYADLFLGLADTFGETVNQTWQPRQNYLGMYVQDAWKVTPRLTVNAGVRWEPFLSPTNAVGHTGVFEQSWFTQGLHSNVYPNAPAGILFPGDTMPMVQKCRAVATWEKRRASRRV